MSVQSHFSKTSLASSGNSDIPGTDFSQQAPRGQLFLPQLQEQRHLSWLCVRESQICPASQPALSSCHLRPSLLFKLHCTLRKIRFLQTGILAMQEAGIQGQMVVENYWMEVFNCERFSGPSLTHRLNIWKDADTSLDFNAWLKSAACRQNPKIQELEQSEAQRGGALRIDYLTAKETARYEIHFLNDAHGVYLVRQASDF